MPCPISTSTCRNFETISSGLGRLFAILGPPFPKHSGGPVQLGRLTAAFHLGPVVDRLAEHLKASTKLFMDETTAPVLDPGRGRTKTGYLWALARDDRRWGGDDPPGVVFTYAPGRAGENAEKILQGFDGILQLDGYTGYNRLTRPSRKGGSPIRVAHCWAHARRKLKEVFDRDGSEIAAEGLRRIAEFYKVEADIRGAAPGQRLSARQARTAALVAEFGEWLQQQRLRISAKSRLGEKLAYIHRHWDGLQTFLQDGRVEIDSNSVENLIRPIALNRKNALFAGHDEGGKAWGRIASLIETAKINGVEPFAYLKATLEAIRETRSTNSSLGTSRRQAEPAWSAAAAYTSLTTSITMSYKIRSANWAGGPNRAVSVK